MQTSTTFASSLLLLLLRITSSATFARAQTTATSTTSSAINAHTDCATAETIGMDRGCDTLGNYFTCTDGIEILFTCTGDCYLDGEEAPRCNDGVATYVGSY